MRKCDELIVTKVGACGHDDLAGFVHRIARKVTSICGGLNRFESLPNAVDLLRDLDLDALAGATILFTNDDVLRDVNQTTSQVARLCGTKCRISKTLTSTVRCDEVLENGQAFAVVRLNRTLNELLLRVGHQTTHTRDLLDLRPVTTRARVDHAVHSVAIVEVTAHVVCNLLGAFEPKVNEVLVAVFFEDEAGVKVFLNLGCASLVFSKNFFLAWRRLDVGERDRDTRPRRPVEAGRLQGIEAFCNQNVRVTLGQGVDDLTELLLADDLVDERVVNR